MIDEQLEEEHIPGQDRVEVTSQNAKPELYTAWLV